MIERLALPLLSALALSACGEDHSAPSMHLACTHTVNAYAFARDAIDVEAYGALFTDDVEFTFAGDTMVGRDAVMANLAERGPAFVTRHFITSVIVHPNGDGTGSGSNKAMVFSPPTQAGGPPQALKPEDLFALVQYDDEYRMDDDKCLMSKRVVNIEYLRGAGGAED
jgi:hypothetical protein